jgi:hypothetical protein
MQFFEIDNRKPMQPYITGERICPGLQTICHGRLFTKDKKITHARILTCTVVVNRHSIES